MINLSLERLIYTRLERKREEEEEMREKKKLLKVDRK